MTEGKIFVQVDMESMKSQKCQYSYAEVLFVLDLLGQLVLA